jgi:L-ascorbate 6-phosphate lactonase
VVHDGDQLSEAVGQLELGRFVPVHWDMWRDVGAGPKSLHEDLASYEYPRPLEVVRIGDCLGSAGPA